MGGWICLHRKIQEWEWYHDTNTFRVFIHLLLNANWEDTKYMGMTVKRGSLVIKQSQFGKEITLTKWQVRTSLDKLKATNEITTQTHNKFTIVTIVNFNNYQDKELINKITNTTQNQHEYNSDATQSQRIDKQLNNINMCPSGHLEFSTKNESCQGGFVNFYLNNINPTASSFELEQLISYKDDFEDEKLIIKAIEIAIENNKRRLSYIKGILNNWISENIKTLDQWEAREKIRQEEKQGKELRELYPNIPEPTYNISEEERQRITNEFFND